ncbi:MAG: hypothetical protein DWQ40_08560 [Actinobacteria bacterium]|nr:MAG: hypothetical protein DWQ40_08560 [Actinomycetota bacterium]
MPPPVAAIFSALLILTGVSKLRRPDDTSKALSMLGIPFAPSVALGLGLLEVTVGGTALATSSSWVFAVQATLYAGFLGWVTIALVRNLPIASCGCLGTPDTPPYWGHVVLDGAAVIASTAAAIAGPITIQSWWAGITSLLLISLGVWLAWEILGTGARAASLSSR